MAVGQAVLSRHFTFARVSVHNGLATAFTVQCSRRLKAAILCLGYPVDGFFRYRPVGIIDYLTKSLMYFCLDVCGTAPWLSYVGSDDQTMNDS